MAAPQALASLFTSHSHSPVSDTLFRQLALPDLVRISSTCTGGHKAIRRYNKRAFSINRLLERFFDNPLEFRALQARTGTLISGSQALQFFARTYWPESDLDLYTCPDYESTFELGQWIEEQGYYFTPHSYQHPEFSVAVLPPEDVLPPRVWDETNPVDVKAEQLYCIGSISCIFAFEKVIPESGEVRKVQVIVGRHSPLQVILESHSTAVMNFISWNRAYSLYPYATLEKGRSLSCLVPERRTVRADKALVKYHERGFKLVANLYAHEEPRCAFHLGPRFVGDKHACVMSLDVEVIEWTTSNPNLPSFSRNIDFYVSNGWELQRRSGESDPAWYHRRTPQMLQMASKQLFTSALLHKYTTSETFLEYVLPFIRAQGTVEHMKLNDAEAAAYAGRDNEKPSFWHYYDEEYAQIVQQWLRDGMPRNNEDLTV